MPKMTAKYKAAVNASYQFKIASTQDQETLYAELEKNGLQWDSDQQQWISLADEPADEPTPFVMVHVWADAEIVEEAADLVAKSLKGFVQLERSKPYICRPPKQLEARVYLKFMQKGKANGHS